MRNRADAITGAVLAAAAVIAVVWVIPAETKVVPGESLPASLMPSIAASSVGFLAALLFLRSLWSRGRTEKQAEEGAPNEEPRRALDHARVIRCAGVVVAGTAAIAALGSIVGGIVLVSAFMVAVGERRIAYIGATAIGATGLIYTIFEIVLSMRLP